MKSLLVFFVCVTLVSYYGTQGDKQPDDKEDSDEQDEENRRQFPGPYPGINAAQAAGQAAAIANGQGYYRPIPRPVPRPTVRPESSNKCYSCVDCPDPDKLQATCTTWGDSRCVTYVEKYKHRRHPLTVRGCVSERGSCDDLRRSHENKPDVQLVSCEICVGERCNTNGVSRSLPDLTAALFFVVLTPMLTKYALS